MIQQTPEWRWVPVAPAKRDVCPAGGHKKRASRQARPFAALEIFIIFFAPCNIFCLPSVFRVKDITTRSHRRKSKMKKKYLAIVLAVYMGAAMMTGCRSNAGRGLRRFSASGGRQHCLPTFSIRHAILSPCSSFIRCRASNNCCPDKRIPLQERYSRRIQKIRIIQGAIKIAFVLIQQTDLSSL